MINLKELARIANVGGDIRQRQQIKGKAKKAEKTISRLTSDASRAVEGGYKGEKLLNAAKFFSMFIPGAGKAINIGLSGADALAEYIHSQKLKKQFEQKTKGMPGGPFKKYLKQNMDAIMSQVEQSADSSLKANLMKNIKNIGLKALPMDKLSESMKKTVGEMYPMEQVKLTELFGDKVADAPEHLLPKDVTDIVKNFSPGLSPELPGAPIATENIIEEFGGKFASSGTPYKIPNPAFNINQPVSPLNVDYLQKYTSPDYGGEFMNLNPYGRTGKAQTLLASLSDKVGGGTGVTTGGGGIDFSKLGSPSVRDLYSLGEPYLRSLMRGKPRPTSPAAPGYGTSSIRGRRIV